MNEKKKSSIRSARKMPFAFQEKKILISAQTYLTKFYNSLGFSQIGEGYLEDGIPHISMIKTA